MKALSRRSGVAIALFLAGAAAAAPATAGAQRAPRPGMGPGENTPRLMVPTLDAGNVTGLGVTAADAIRSRLTQDFSSKDLWIIPKNDIHGTLQASGFDPEKAQDRTTYKQLATMLRADEFIDGRIEKTSSGFRVNANMVLARDANMVQPLPAVEGARMLDMATALSNVIKDARKQLADERKCENAIRDNKPDEAITAARASITAYPRSTIGRVCMAQAFINKASTADSATKKALADSVLALTSRVLELDPNNKLANLYAYRAYRETSQEEPAIRTCTQLMTLDPTNTAQIEQCVEYIAASQEPKAALPVIDTAITHNPGVASLLRLKFRLQLASRMWKEAQGTGEEVARTDTALADTLFFRLLTVSYATDSNFTKAAEVAARGSAKFPNNVTLLGLQAEMLRRAGQIPQSIEVSRKALALNPKDLPTWLAIVRAQIDMNQRDTALATLRQALGNFPTPDSATRAQVNQFAGAIANQIYRGVAASKSAADVDAAIPKLFAIDTLMGGAAPEPKFYLGTVAYLGGATTAQELQNARPPTCDLAKRAQSLLAIAAVQLPAGGRFQPAPTGQMLTQLQQISPYVDAQVQRLCK